jgi:hypothetical protein
MKVFIAGVWTLIVSLGATFAVVYLGSPPPATAVQAPKPALEVQKTRVLNVPMIANGAVQGFIVAQFAYTVDPKQAKGLSVPPDVFLLDEAFRRIYTDDHLDFMHLNKYDVGALTTFLVTATNKRLGMDVVHDVLVQDFSFISKEQADQ